MFEQQDEPTFVEYDEQGDRIINPGNLTILEQQHFQKARQTHKHNMIKQQKIGLKIFKGNAFIAKPSTIMFKDFKVGKMHCQVINLTNVSNAFNSFNVLPLPEQIRNYFEVEFTPKGKISPGISCDIKFKFLPQLNEDIQSQFMIMAETGHISFPLICTSQKAIIKANNTHVDLGKVIFGEKGYGKLHIYNQGALPTDMVIMTSAGTDLDKCTQDQSKHISQLNFKKHSHIEGYSTKNIDFEFQPTEIGPLQLQLKLYIKKFEHSPPIMIKLTAICVQVHVRIQRKLYDFQICLLNHVYREKLIFYNSSENSISFKMIQDNDTRKCLEFNPVVGYIQKQSKIQIWVKLIAQKNLHQYLSKYEKQQNIYCIPFHMNVKQQLLPVNFEIQFKITSQKVSIIPAELNFGTIFEGLSSKIQVTFRNQSNLPQEILLCPSKKEIYLENNQPLYKLLPKQTIQVYIVYRSKKLQSNKSLKQQGSIVCKIITGEIATNEVKLDYSCQIVPPDLYIHHNQINLPAVQINQICKASTIIKNKTNKKLIYEMFVPYFEVCGLKITPVVKQLNAKKQVQVNIQYHSFMKKLTSTTLANLNNKQQSKLKEKSKNKEIQSNEQNKKDSKKDAKKDGKKQPKLTKQQQQQLELEQKKIQEEKQLQKQKEQQQKRIMEANFNMEAQLNKIGGKYYSFDNGQHYKWLLPIYFKQREHPDASAEVTYIEITTTSTKQTLLIDCDEVDFGEIAVGGRAVKQIKITNQGESALLNKKQLPIFCCFSVLNSMKVIDNQQSWTAVVQFQPIQQQKFENRLIFYTNKYTISCNLKGKGVRPDIHLQPQSGILSLGGILIEQYIEKTFKINNICKFNINFILKSIYHGINNSNCSNAITYIPMSGVIPADGQIIIKVIFKPDRVSYDYFEKIKVQVAEQKQQKFIFVTGFCCPRQAYIRDFQPVTIPKDIIEPIESSLDWLSIKDEDKMYGPNNKVIILEFKRDNKQLQEKDNCFKKKIIIGSCKLLDSKNQKPTNFEVIMPKDDNFQCDVPKGTTTAGTETIITFTYKPQDSDPFIASIPILKGIGQWRQNKVQLKISGGLIKAGIQDAISFEVILRAYMNQL